MDQDYDDSTARNIVIREGEVPFERIAGVDGGVIRWAGKEYVLKEVLECKCDSGFCDSGDCQCNQQVSRCCP